MKGLIEKVVEVAGNQDRRQESRHQFFKDNARKLNGLVEEELPPSSAPNVDIRIEAPPIPPQPQIPQVSSQGEKPQKASWLKTAALATALVGGPALASVGTYLYNRPSERPTSVLQAIEDSGMHIAPEDRQ